MVPEPVRKAARKLAPLLQRRGTSPEVGRTLRRAVEHLDVVLATDDLDAHVPALRIAVAELERCLAFIRTSARPADHEQAADVTGVLKILTFMMGPPTELLPPRVSRDPVQHPPAPVVSPAPVPATEPPPPVAASSPTHDSSRGVHVRMVSPPPESIRASPPSLDSPDPVPSGSSAEHATPPAYRPTRRSGITASATAAGRTAMVPRRPRNPAALAQHLEGLVAAGRRRAVALEHLPMTWRELAGLERKMEAELRALRWLGPLNEDDVKRLATAPQSPGVLLDIASCFVGAAVPARAPAAPSRSDPNDIGTYFSVLRACARPEDLHTLDTAFHLPDALPWRAIVLGALVESSRLDATTLVRLLDDADDRIPLEAARVLAWIGGPDERQAVSARARSAIAPNRASAFTVAAVALGDEELLNEVRTRVIQADGEPLLLDALALAGTASDAEILVRVAGNGGPLAAAAVRAAGRLGNPDVLADLARLEGELQLNAVGAALADILGSNRGLDERGADRGRLFRGEPWSVAAVMKAVTSPDEPVKARADLALELVVRTGIRPAFPYDHLSSARAQAEAAASLGTIFERQQPFPSGRWLFRGYVLRR